MIAYLLTASLFLSQDYSPDPPTFRGGVWMPRLGGTVKDGTDAIDFESNVQLHTRESSPLVEFEIDPFDGALLKCSIFDFSTSSSGTYVGNDIFGSVTFQQGERWRGSTDIQSIGFTASLDYIAPYKTSENATLAFAPVVGLRWFGVKTQLSNTTRGTTQEHQDGWVALIVGFEMHFTWDTSEVTNIVDSVAISSEFVGGVLTGGDGGSMWGVQAGIEFEFSPSLGGYFGYRLQELNAEDGAYTFDAGIQGLYVGGQLRF